MHIISMVIVKQQLSMLYYLRLIAFLILVNRRFLLYAGIFPGASLG